MKNPKTYTNPKTGEVSTLYFDKKSQSGGVERIIDEGTDYEDAVHTGVWVEGGELVDYDGVYCLHEDTAKVLRLNGIRVPKKEFETVGG